jgi:hypothetical protein
VLLPVEEGEVRAGVSLVAACRGRHEALRRTLPTWLALRHVNEVVIVDWSSEPPLEGIVREITGNPRVKVVRVEGERDWVLSRAYNLAVGVAGRAEIVRTDCDYAIEPGFVRAHDLDGDRPEGKGARRARPARPAAGEGEDGAAFYAGDYRMARDENEVHLNGAVFIHRQDFVRIGGYDERIQTYGWDDTDLYQRLGGVGMQQRNVSYDHIRHVRHGEAARRQATVSFAQVEIDLNALLLKHLEPWSAEMARGDGAGGEREAGTRWAVLEAGGPSNYVKVRATRKPLPLRALVDRDRAEKDWELAMGRRLRDDYEVPWDVIGSMGIACKEKVLRGLVEMSKGKRRAQVARLLFVHAMHGLGNRLRAVASAMSFAERTGRVLVIVWETDVHISAEFADLFVDRDLPVMTSWKPTWPFAGNEKWDLAWAKLHAINYLEMEGRGAVKDAFVVDRPDMHLYFKSSSVMNTARGLAGWDRENAMLRTLTPVPEVLAMVRDHVVRSGLTRRIGMHIRDRTLARDIKNVNFTTEYGDKASDTMDYWRRQSSHTKFAAEMARLVTADPSAKFYVASDTREVTDDLARQFPGRILSTPRDCDGRDGHCVRFALVDMLSLAKTRKLYGSNWSSFTEAAQRFGAPKALLAGQDFGREKGAAGKPTGT